MEENWREFALPAGSALLIILITFFFLIPKVRQILALRSSIAGQKAQISRLSQKVSDLLTLSEADLAESAGLVTEAFPPQQDMFKSLAMTKKIFEDNGLLIESFSFSGSVSSSSAASKTPAEEKSPLKINVSFYANFENFRKMIKEVEKILPLMKVEGLKFGSLEATASASIPSLSGKISLVSFSSPLPKTMGRTDQPLPKISNEDKKLIEELKTFSRYQVEEEVSTASALPVGKENPFSF